MIVFFILGTPPHHKYATAIDNYNIKYKKKKINEKPSV